MMEIWKDIQGYEGLYQVSNEGRIKSLGNNKKRKEKILKAQRRKKYLDVALHKNKNEKKYLIHRLVAQAFIPNPDNLPEINHKNECTTDNSVENLEWCDHIYNSNYGTRITRIINSRKNDKYFKLVSACCRGLL